MVSDPTSYLAAQVLNEDRAINYRNLSRTFKIRNNEAKRILHDFHRTQNARKAKSVHATYLVTGVRKPNVARAVNGESERDGMDADGFNLSSSLPEQIESYEVEDVPMTTITLVREEDLQALQQLYSSILGTEMYSIQPNSPSNIHTLSDCNRKVTIEAANEDPLQEWGQYGVIHNPKAKRRQNKRPVQPAAGPTVPMTAGMKAAPKSASIAASVVENQPSTLAAKPKEQPKQTPALKKGSSNFFAGFKKTQAKEQAEADVVMEDVSEGDDELESIVPATKADKTSKENAGGNTSKSDREKELEKMMEADSDVEMERDDEREAPDEREEQDTKREATATDVQEGEEQPPIAAVMEAAESTSAGKRRGRRQVMKKKTTRDAEGYLVTKEEPVWESFSEDEAEVVRSGTKGSSQRTGAPGQEVNVRGNGPASGGKTPKGAKPGQGNIMSFFAKR